MANVAGRGRFQSLGYILHSYPYKETSLIVEAFARHMDESRVLQKVQKGLPLDSAALFNFFSP